MNFSYKNFLQLKTWNHEVDITVDALSIHDIDNDGLPDIIYGDDQWGSIYGLNCKTGEEFWTKKNPDHGVTAIRAADFDGDGRIEIGWGTGYSSTGADYFIIVDAETKHIEWFSQDLDEPFLGYDIALNPTNLEFEILLTSSKSNSGYDGGKTFAFDFYSKEEIWSKENGDSWSGVNALVAGDVDMDGSGEVITFGSRTYDGRVHVMNLDDGNLKYTAELEQVLKSGLLEDMNNDGQMEILVGDSRGTITILNGNDGSEYNSFTQIGSDVVENLATTRNNQSVVDRIFALTRRDGVWFIDTENNRVGKVGNSSVKLTSLATVFNQGWNIFVGDEDGQLFQLGADLQVENTYQLCQGPLTHMQGFRDSELSFTCEECFGLFDFLSGEVLVRQGLERPVWRAQAYSIDNQLGGDTLVTS